MSVIKYTLCKTIFQKMANFSTKTKKISGTVALYLSFFALGLCTAIPGPTLLDLQQIVHTETNKIAFIYLARSSGYLVGSLIGGIVFDIIKRTEVLLILCNFIMALSALITPWSRNIETLIATLAVGGLSMGALDTGANVLCLNIWGNEHAPYFQALHFLFGVGAVLAPLIAEPFLEKLDHENYLTHLLHSNETAITSNITTTESSIFHFNQSSDLVAESSVPLVTYSYTIIGVYALCASFCFIIVYMTCPQKRIKATMASENASSVDMFTVSVVLLSQIILSLYCGVEIGYGQMLATYAVKGNLQLSKSIASFLTAAFWGTFTCIRGISIYLSSKFSAFTMVFCDLTIVTFGCIILLAFGNTQAELLWIGTIILAAGLSSFYPSFITWINNYINVTNKIASLFVISASAGEMIIPLVVSHFMESFPHMLMYIIFGCSVLCCIMSFLLWLIMTRRGERNLNMSSSRVNSKLCDTST